MTIASEITRLQNDKAAICTAIENKGVTVGNVTLDSYAACICAIEQGGGGQYVDVFIVGGGGAGQNGGGGAGGVINMCKYGIEGDVPVVVGVGGVNASYSCRTNGGHSCFGSLVAYGGGGGGSYCGGTSLRRGGCGGSGGGGVYNCAGGNGCGVCFPYIKGNSGGFSNMTNMSSSGGGGGAGGSGEPGACNNNNLGSGNGGYGIVSDFNGVSTCYAGGGGGGGPSGHGCGRCGGGNASTSGVGGSATTYGSGGGGTACPTSLGGSGCQGIVMVRYPSDGSYGINSATGGTKSSATISGTNYCIHTFTSNGTFTIVS